MCSETSGYARCSPFRARPSSFLRFGFGSRRLADEPSERSLRRAAGIALGGSVMIVLQALPLEAFTQPIAPFALYAAAHAAGMVGIGLTLASPRWLAMAQALWVATLLTLAQRYESPRLNEFVPFIVVPMFAFFALPLLTPRARGDTGGFIAGALALVTHYAILYLLARTVWPDIALGVGSIVAGALALAMLSFARPLVRERKRAASSLPSAPSLWRSSPQRCPSL